MKLNSFLRRATANNQPRHRSSPRTRLRVESLEDRAVPSFGFGWAFKAGTSGRNIVADGSGNTYVSGAYSGTTDFDPNHTNPSSNHILTGAGGGFLAKYLADGTFQWVTNSLGSTGKIAVQGTHVLVPCNGGNVAELESATGAIDWTTNFTAGVSASYVTVSPSGAMYAAGQIQIGGIRGPSFTLVMQLDASGNVLWSQATSVGLVAVRDLGVDAAGNVFATGIYGGTATFGTTSLTSSGSQSAFVWTLDPAGNSIWAGSMGSDGATSGLGLAVDNTGNVFVAGTWTGSNNNFNPGFGSPVTLTNHGSGDVFVAKLSQNADGSLSLAWAKDIGGTLNDEANSLAVDSHGNVYTTGYFAGTVNFNPNSGPKHNIQGYNSSDNVFVSKLDANGNYVDAVQMGGANSVALASGISVDVAGNVYTTGHFTSTADFNPTNGTYNLTSNGASGFVSKLTQSSPQLAAGPGPNVGVVPLTQKQLSAVETAAIRDWAAAGLPAADLARMRSVTADSVNLDGDHLGAAELNGTEIAIDATADGWGWSVDPNAKPMSGRMDLLTVIEHELGHTIGLDSRFDGNPHDLMYAYLSPGERRLPTAGDVKDAATAVALLGESPRLAAEDTIDWTTAIAALKPKKSMFADWLTGE
jgi:hypothetical protein